MSQTEQTFRRLRARLVPEIAKEMRLQSVELAEYIKSQHLTGGTTPTRLAVRTGRLRASVKPVPITRAAGTIEGGVQAGTIYAPIHFGKRGTTTKIKPKTKKFLTIPLDAAKTPAGVLRGSARSGVFGETFVRRTKAGNLVIFGKRVAQKGRFAGQARGKIYPLFLLVKEVEVPARIDPEELLRWWQPKVVRAMNRLVARAVERGT